MPRKTIPGKAWTARDRSWCLDYTDPYLNLPIFCCKRMKSARLVPKIRILIGAVVAIGPGKAALLAGIARTGSISAAAREMKMSYRRGWLLVEAMNSAFRWPLVETLTGGEGGAGPPCKEERDRVLPRYCPMNVSRARQVGQE